MSFLLDNWFPFYLLLGLMFAGIAKYMCKDQEHMLLAELIAVVVIMFTWPIIWTWAFFKDNNGHYKKS